MLFVLALAATTSFGEESLKKVAAEVESVKRQLGASFGDERHEKLIAERAERNMKAGRSWQRKGTDMPPTGKGYKLKDGNWKEGYEQKGGIWKEGYELKGGNWKEDNEPKDGNWKGVPMHDKPKRSSDLPQCHCENFRNGQYSFQVGKETCAKSEAHGLWSQKQVWCEPPMRPLVPLMDSGCPSDMHRCVVAYVPPTFPKCTCNTYDNGASPTATEGLCQKRTEPDVCISPNNDYDLEVGNAQFYNCPLDTVRCQGHFYGDPCESDFPPLDCPECKKSADCKISTDICVHGDCVDPCETDLHCKVSEICIHGGCVDKCKGVKCPKHETCTLGHCVDPCKHDVHCEDDEICVDGGCVDPCKAVRCETNEVCVIGHCVDPCETDVHCEKGEICIDGGCVDQCKTITCPKHEVCKIGHCVDPCKNDVHCEEDETCIDGGCVNKCKLAHCTDKEVCDNGVCVDRCSLCLPNEICDENHQCVLGNPCDLCIPDVEICENDICVPDPCIDHQCSN